jgi:hypothetical protein
MISDANPAGGDGGTHPRSAAVTFVTTEHFTLQGARAVAWKQIAQHRYFEGD